MFLFRSNRRVSVERHGKQQELSPARGKDANYVTSMYDFIELRSSLPTREARRALSRVEEEDWLATHRPPLELGISNRGEFQRKKAAQSGQVSAMPFRAIDNQVMKLKGDGVVRLAILNGFGTGLSDTLVGLTAFREVRKRIQTAGIGELDVEMWVRPSGYDSALAVTSMHGGVDRVKMLPMPIDAFLTLDGYWDLGGLVDRPTVNTRCTVDFFLELMGIDPTAVPRNEKRNRLSLSIPVVKEVGDALRDRTRRYVILHPIGGSLERNMPAEVFRELCTRLVRETDMDVASLVPLPNMHPRHVDLSELSSRGFEQYCALIKNAAGLVTVDASAYHVADAFSVPTVAIFSMVNPELRARYYPNVECIVLPGTGSASPGNQPRAGDVLSAWPRLDLNKVVELLVEQMPPV
ncbi:MAG: glycosyltransferase family 9 protein [Gammaproteobacteria bacterium]|jgi:hypothetical protein